MAGVSHGNMNVIVIALSFANIVWDQIKDVTRLCGYVVAVISVTAFKTVIAAHLGQFVDAGV